MDPKDATTAATSAATSAVRDLGGFIREQRKSAQLSLRKLAALAGVSNPYLSQIERGMRKPSADILQAIAGALRISAESLYVQAGILEERDDDLAARILVEPHLTEGQRRALLEVYLAFRQDLPGPAQAPGPSDPPDAADAPDASETPAPRPRLVVGPPEADAS